MTTQISIHRYDDVLGDDSESHNTVLLSVQPRLCTLIFISFYQAVFGEDNLCASAAAQKQVIPVITPHSGGSSVGLWSYKWPCNNIFTLWLRVSSSSVLEQGTESIPGALPVAQPQLWPPYRRSNRPQLDRTPQRDHKSAATRAMKQTKYFLAPDTHQSRQRKERTKDRKRKSIQDLYRNSAALTQQVKCLRDQGIEHLQKKTKNIWLNVNINYLKNWNLKTLSRYNQASVYWASQHGIIFSKAHNVLTLIIKNDKT